MYLTEPEQVNYENYKELLPELMTKDYRFLLDVYKRVPDIASDLRPLIVDKFITEKFEAAEWEERFDILEAAKKVYVDAVFPNMPDFKEVNITKKQKVMISKAYLDDLIETLVIESNKFITNLSPMEVIVLTLKDDWGKSYSVIGKSLHRDPRNIETTYKRAKRKMEGSNDIANDPHRIEMRCINGVLRPAGLRRGCVNEQDKEVKR